MIDQLADRVAADAEQSSGTSLRNRIAADALGGVTDQRPPAVRDVDFGAVPGEIVPPAAAKPEREEQPAALPPARPDPMQHLFEQTKPVPNKEA